MGLSDSALHLARTRLASAAVSPSGGKNVDLLLHAIDRPHGTLDPAFDAHANLVLTYAIAVWGAWFTRQQFELAFQQASLKLMAKEDESWWRLVTGPITALLASLRRIGWVMPNAFEVIDDLGTSWHLGVHAPGSIAIACSRWRLNRIGSLLPGLIPNGCDVGSPTCTEDTILVDMSDFAHPYLHGIRSGARRNDGWDPAWRHSLFSASVGGQWTQVRKASVPSWAIVDNRCQLCLQSPGTYEHRFLCSSILPQGGWPEPPAEAKLALNRLSGTRKQHLNHHGLLVLRLPAPPRSDDGYFKWIVKPATDNYESASVCWHFDGSMLNGRWKSLRSTGYGIVLTLANGQLLGYGYGSPPHWCRTAAAAEAWALHQVLAQSEFVPCMRTDCLALIATAAAGVTRATNPRKQLARIWSLVTQILDGDLQRLGDHRMLVWLPAHNSPSAIGEVKMSNGARLTHVDWRANRLADGLAKLAAADGAAPMAVIRLLKSAQAAVEHCARLLGRVTHAANHHVVQRPDTDGNLVNHTLRDSVDAPRAARPAKCNANLPAAPEPTVATAPREVKPWVPPRSASCKLSARTSGRQRRQLEAERETELLERRVRDVGSRLRPTSQRPAVDRLQRLRERVAQRQLL